MDQSNITSALDIFDPQFSEFEIGYLNRRFRLRPMTLGDTLWFSKQYPAANELEVVLNSGNPREFCRIALRLMVPEDQTFFVGQTVKFVDDMGGEVSEQLGGSELLFRIMTFKDIKGMIKAVVSSIGCGQMVEKSSEPQEKKRPPEHATGPTSSIYSPLNTVGATNTSCPGHHDKSKCACKQSEGEQTSG